MTSTTQTYEVVGMTCGHCRGAVMDEVGRVPGVDAVDVDLESGRLEVRGEGVTADRVREAVEEAGYALAGAGAQ